MTEVTLADYELKWCLDVAYSRMAVSDSRNMNHASTYKRNHLQRLDEEIVGACGECATAKVLGAYWAPTVNTFHKHPDIEPDIEVRSTKDHGNKLIVRANDPEDRWYFLVTGTPPTMVVRGCIRGRDARRDEWVNNPRGHRPAWFVPQSALLPPEAVTA